MRLNKKQKEIWKTKNSLKHISKHTKFLKKQALKAYIQCGCYPNNSELVQHYNYLRNQYKKSLSKQKYLNQKYINLQKEPSYRPASRTTNIGMALISVLLIISFASYLEPSQIGITGYFASTTSENISSSVNITKNIAIQSNNLNEIAWNSELKHNTTDNAAEHNSDGLGGNSTYYISMGPNTSINADLYIKATELNTSSGHKINLGNYTYSNSTSADPPSASNSVEFTESFAKSMTNVKSNESIYLRFWIDIPYQQPPGKYNNTVTFKLNETTG